MSMHKLFAQLCLERAARFEEMLGAHEPDSCWPWPGANDGRSGYGRFKLRSDWSAATHRIAFVLANGPIPSDMDVLHRCDNPPCCNPAHLFIGGHKDNMADMVRKVRSAGGGYAGEKNKNAKLTEKQVLEIKAMMRAGRLNKEIVPLFPAVGHAAISRIRHGKSWRSVST